MNVARRDVALAALRLMLGAAFVVHGFPKIVHPFTWAKHDLPGAPTWLAAISAIVEFGGGILVAAGLVTRFAAFFIATDMVVAIFLVLVPRGTPFVATHSGPSFETPLAYVTISFALVLMGAGSISLDALRERGRGGKLGSRARRPAPIRRGRTPSGPRG